MTFEPNALDDLAGRFLDVVHYPDHDRAWPIGLFKALALLLIWEIVARVVVNISMRVLRQITSRTKTTFDDDLLLITEKPLKRLVVLAGFYYAIDALPLPTRVHQLATGMVYVVAVYMSVKLLHQVSLLFVSAYEAAVADAHGKAQFEKDYLPLISKVIGTVLATIGLTLVLNHFGQNVQSLVAALGVGGIAIGFAAKDTLGNMMAGFTILADRPFRPGDRIKLSTGETGDVLVVGTRSTRVKMTDGNMLIVPNSELVNGRVVNFNYPDVMTRGLFRIGVAHGTDLDASKKIVLEVLAGVHEIAKEPQPAVLFTQVGDYALELTAYFFVKDFMTVGTAEDKVRQAVYRRFAEAGIKIPYPTHEVVGGGAMTGPMPDRAARG